MTAGAGQGPVPRKQGEENPTAAPIVELVAGWPAGTTIRSG
jgi:hypothetical protein